jgi:hypothetical protein
MEPTFYEIASDLYDTKKQPPSGKHYHLVYEALDRLGWVSIKIFGYNAVEGMPDPNCDYTGYLAESNLHRHVAGLQRLRVRLAEWLRNELDNGAPVRLDWHILRAFDENQKLAKRLWIYLASERWKPVGGRSMEATWIACGDRLEAALGMTYKRPRAAREALKRACKTIREVDDRYLAGSLDVVKVGTGWQIRGKRPITAAWKDKQDQYKASRTARDAVRKSLKAS